MRLPNGEHAVVDIAKLRDYCLSPTHPRGKHKAYVFAQVLGLTSDRAEDLRRVLLGAAAEEPALEGHADEYGRRFVVDVEVDTGLRKAVVRSAWIIRTGEDFPRFTSCYVLEEGKKL